MHKHKQIVINDELKLDIKKVNKFVNKLFKMWDEELVKKKISVNSS